MENHVLCNWYADVSIFAFDFDLWRLQIVIDETNQLLIDKGKGIKERLSDWDINRSRWIA